MRPHPVRRQRGSALSLAILVSVVLTGMVLALAWAAALHTQLAAQVPNIDAAYYTAQAGLEHGIWKFRHDQLWRTSNNNPLTGTLAMGNATWGYSVTCTDAIGDATLAWKLDEGSGAVTADTSGHGNTGTFHGGVWWFANGRSGPCVQFNGVDGYIDCGNNASTNLTGDVTFAAWVKMNSPSYDQKIGGNQDGVRGGYKLCIYNSKVEFEVRDASNKAHLNRDVAGGTVLTMGTWYHVAGIYSEANHTIKTYVNGKLDRTLNGTGAGTGLNDVPVGALASTAGSFVMGREPWNAATYYFNGYLDDVRIFNRALSDTDVKAIFDTTVDIRATVTAGDAYSTLAAACSIPTPPAPSAPVLLSGTDLNIKNLQIIGDVEILGSLSSSPGNSSLQGNLRYTGSLTSGPLSISGNTSKVAAADILLPNIDYAALRAKADPAFTVTGNSKDQTFSFNSVSGSKVIYIKGDLENPSVTIGGTYASGGTFIVDGQVRFTTGSPSLGTAGYPVYIVSVGDITHSSGKLTMTGALYTLGRFDHKTVDITGVVYAPQGIINNANGQCTFSVAPIPWMDQRAVPQPSTLPLYTSNYRGIGP